VCTVSTSGVAFGSFNPLAGQSADTTGTISVTCTGIAGDSANYTITIASGLGSFTARKMVSGTDNLSYNLYKDSGCTQVWGDGSGSTYTVADSMTLSSPSNTKNYVVYSRIASGQNAAKAHSYSDSPLVTITY
jgi:spore coat protein U-like protein